uniref:Polycystin 1 like 1, transient receptor potential channel interacting n=1 Tax=Molossus molossus TaxID=27622 RepID=A0A7J8HDV7_MOLMO|nr:polycystin 1 like 1, transient receptor potential channel interacting [Molossus molossus]
MRVRWLQGTLSFLLTLRCIHLLGWQSRTVPCAVRTHRSLSGVCAPGLAGVLMLAAHSHLRGIPLSNPAPPSGTFTDTFHRLFFCLPGNSLSPSGWPAAAACYLGLLAAAAALWCAMLRGSLMAFTPKRKCFRNQSLVRLGDVTAAMWGTARSALGLERWTPEETEPAACPNHALDEFADLLDELLLKIEGLSEHLQPLPEQQPHGPMPARAEGRPLEGAAEDHATGPQALQSHGDLGCAQELMTRIP